MAKSFKDFLGLKAGLHNVLRIKHSPKHDSGSTIYITNYETIKHFVCDIASITSMVINCVRGVSGKRYQ